ncbi:DNA polymerase III subunit beta [Kineococcus arenarius]|uniref:DNA polymerase III subunit beta n=1 Tax=Kineococcus sp. SYSU DK007 TaxID=3383128 RepID=UPI003D7D40B9
MELQVERDVLADAVAWAARALPSRPPVPVLAGVLLEAGDDGTLRLSTFDYEVSARVEVPAEVRTGGRVLVSGRLLADISRSLPPRPVTLTTDGSKVVVTCGASRFTLLTMSVDEYPALPAMPGESGTVPGSEFTEAVAQVTVAASRDETLPILTGVRLEIEGGRLTLLATDRYRLAVRELRWNPSTPDFTTAALVRARTLSDVARSLGGTSTLRMALADGGSDLIGFSADGRQSTSLLVDGEYPKVRALFPAESPTHAVVSTAALAEAVKRVALVAERNTPVRLRFEDGVLSLEAGQGEDAQATEALEASLMGEPIAIAFNPQFLLDGLGALSAPYARLSFTQSTRPAVITGQAEAEGEDDDSYRYLLMPVRLAG